MLQGRHGCAKMRNRSPRQFWNKAEIPHATRTIPIRKNARPQSPTVLEQGRDTACYKDGTDPQKCATAVPDNFGTRPRYRMLQGQYRSAKMRDRSPRQFWNKAEIPHATRTAPIHKNARPQSPTVLEQGRDTACYKDSTDPKKCSARALLHSGAPK